MYVFKILNYVVFLKLVLRSTNKKVIRFDRYEICELPPKSPIVVSYVHVKRAGYGSVVDTKFEVTRDIKVLKIITKITRCSSKEVLDSCEYFTTISLKNACGFAAAKKSVLSPMVYAHKPPFICPLRKGIYVCTNGTFGPNVVNIFPLENFYWKLDQFVYEPGTTDQFLYKFCIDGQVVTLRD